MANQTAPREYGVLTTHVDLDLKAEVERQAEIEDRSVASLVRLALRQYVAGPGVLAGASHDPLDGFEMRR